MLDQIFDVKSFFFQFQQNTFLLNKEISFPRTLSFSFYYFCFLTNNILLFKQRINSAFFISHNVIQYVIKTKEIFIFKLLCRSCFLFDLGPNFCGKNVYYVNYKSLSIRPKSIYQNSSSIYFRRRGNFYFIRMFLKTKWIKSIVF